MLKERLYTDEAWGKQKTDDYYAKWDNQENRFICEGDYQTLFFNSDAMILDSISFMCEYAVLDKPALFTVKDETIKSKFNELGTLCFNEVMYKTENNIQADIIHFIDEVVLNKNDILQKQRKDFVSKYLLSPNGKSASENIFNFLKGILS